MVKTRPVNTPGQGVLTRWAPGLSKVAVDAKVHLVVADILIQRVMYILSLISPINRNTFVSCNC